MTLVPEPSRSGLGPHRSLGELALAGTVVGYIETQFGVDSGTTTLFLVDVRARRLLRSLDAGHYVDAGLISSDAITDFVLTPRGSVAWISERTEHGVLSQRAVHVAAPKGNPVSLDEGTTIDPRSLTLSQGTLAWSDGGAPRTASMP